MTLRNQNFFLLITLLLIWTMSQTQGQLVLEYDVWEEKAPLTFIANLYSDSFHALKLSEDLLNNLKFAFTSQSKYNELFQLDSSNGELKTAIRIDREKICVKEKKCDIELPVSLRSGTYFNILKMVITILDKNDNPPIFSNKMITKEISETVSIGTSFDLPLAEDLDGGVNGIQEYNIKINEYFQLEQIQVLDEIVGVKLILIQQFDREIQDKHTFEITALDGGQPPKIGFLTLQIKIKDANDNYPQFKDINYTFHVYENITTGASIVQMNASDVDLGEGGTVSYSFSDDSLTSYDGLFAIDSASGNIYIKHKIDFESGTTSYTMIVKAIDNGSNHLTTYQKVRIFVIGINDHSPTITINTFSDDGIVRIPESSQMGRVISHVSVVDAENDQFQCKQGNELFQLNQISQNEFKNEFTLLTNSIFDYETKIDYYVTLVCSDNGSPSLSSQKNMKILIEDVNDNYPILEQSHFDKTFTENESLPLVIAHLKAFDLDDNENGMVRYKFLSSEKWKNNFNINEDSGLLVMVKNLDYEVQDSVRIEVIAYDLSPDSKSTTATIDIKLINIDDNMPSFTISNWEFTMTENNIANTFCGKITAIDEDKPPFNTINYKIIEDFETIGLNFHLNKTSGILTVLNSLDREQESSYSFKVRAFNSFNEDIFQDATVLISVLDINDNKPHVTSPENNSRIAVSNQLPIGHSLFIVRAYDSDEGVNSQKSFTLSSNLSESIFVINKFGSVMLKKSLKNFDEESILISLEVSDHGYPQLSSMVYFTLFVSSKVPYTNSMIRGEPSLSQTSIIIIAFFTSLFVIIILICIFIFYFCRWTPKMKLKAALEDKESKTKNKAQLISDAIICESSSNADIVSQLKLEFMKQQAFQRELQRHRSSDLDSTRSFRSRSSTLHDSFFTESSLPEDLQDVENEVRKVLYAIASERMSVTDSGKGDSEDDLNRERQKAKSVAAKRALEILDEKLKGDPNSYMPNRNYRSNYKVYPDSLSEIEMKENSIYGDLMYKEISTPCIPTFNHYEQINHRHLRPHVEDTSFTKLPLNNSLHQSCCSVRHCTTCLHNSPVHNVGFHQGMHGCKSSTYLHRSHTPHDDYLSEDDYNRKEKCCRNDLGQKHKNRHMRKKKGQNIRNLNQVTRTHSHNSSDESSTFFSDREKLNSKLSISPKMSNIEDYHTDLTDTSMTSENNENSDLNNTAIYCPLNESPPHSDSWTFTENSKVDKDSGNEQTLTDGTEYVV